MKLCCHIRIRTVYGIIKQLQFFKKNMVKRFMPSQDISSGFKKLVQNYTSNPDVATHLKKEFDE
jgi:hypothetical protein